MVSYPQNAVQSFATTPPPITSLPLLTVPVHTGTYNILYNSLISLSEHIGWTRAPLFVNWQQLPTNLFPAIVVLMTSTANTSWITSSVYKSISGWTRAM